MGGGFGKHPAARGEPAATTGPAPYPIQPPIQLPPDATGHFLVMEDPVPYRTNPPEKQKDGAVCPLQGGTGQRAVARSPRGLRSLRRSAPLREAPS